jgi:hypothetical protein
LDATLIAYEPEREAAPSASVVPLVIAERDRWGVGLRGSF